MPRSVPLRRTLAALLLSCALVAGATACGGSDDTSGGNAASASAVADPSVSVSASAEKQRLAKTRFVANAGLAAGATYQWIVKPYRAGTFKKGAEG
ncbi:hypothetical protein GTW37_07565, partial [Streptomyces sp. SID4931]|nr:hypothetical protein [Streptomyces sp. SID4931]